jgi:hypothetical protein
MKAPWQVVEHIEHGVGARGGEYWFLTLACGHHAARRKPRFDFARAVFKGLTRVASCEAPHRVRCLLCKR